MSLSVRSSHMALLETEPENEYERQRFLQIQKLQGVLKSMVQPAIDELHASKPTATKPNPPIKRQIVRRQSALPPRRSNRLGDQPAVIYNTDRIFRSMEGEETRRKVAVGRARKLTRGDPNRKARSNDDGWNAYMGIASAAAADEAKDEAEAKVDELETDGKVACLKLMSDSQVSGGFWCQLPRPFARKFNRSSKRVVQLHFEERSWDVVLLPREGGETAGLSGGWRSFAIDQIIYPNDSVVFEKVDEQNINAYLYRAYDYDPNFVRQENIVTKEDVGSDDDGHEDATDMGDASDEKAARGEEEACGEDEALGGEGRAGGSCAASGEDAHPADVALPDDAHGRRRSRRTSREDAERASGKHADAGRSNKAKGTAAEQKPDKKGQGRPKKTDGSGGRRFSAASQHTKSEQANVGLPATTKRKEPVHDNGDVKRKRGRPNENKRKSVVNTQPPGRKSDNVFYVKSIMQYIYENDVDFFKVKWWFYEDDEDDTWETTDSLDAHPSSYVWKCDMPAKFKQ